MARTIVEEGNLTVQIAALRKVLGTRPDGSEWIVTVPRVGYRLVQSDAPVELRWRWAGRPTPMWCWATTRRRWSGRDRPIALTPNYDCCLWMLAAAHAHLGQMDEARRYCAELRVLSPQATVSSIRAGQPAKIPERVEPVLRGLHLAGLPE